ncbi:MAG: hypothetical protein FWD97_02695 [Defluviitaleaceae bacterium]|nr:hypothetical protein [Defluviitaleaceae bacterium]
MILQSIEKLIYQELQVLFTTAIVDEMSGDDNGYSKKLEKVGLTAKVLGIETKIIATTLDLVDNDNEINRLFFIRNSSDASFIFSVCHFTRNHKFFCDFG